MPPPPPLEVPLSLAGEWCRGRVAGDGAAISFVGVSSDSRTIRPGQLFVALRGPNYDGHGFVDQSFAAGAAAAMVENVEVLRGRPGLVVADTLAALGDMAQARRRHPPLIPWIGVTGSNGKTTTREMLARLLSACGSVYASPSNYNNLVGLPLTILNAPRDTNIGVLELGTNTPGEIPRLAGISAPVVAVVTSLGLSHMAGFGNLDTLAREKGAIFKKVPADGLCVYPAADPRAPILLDGVNAPRAGFALEGIADLTATDIENGEEGINFRAGGVLFRTRLRGRHNVANALAALLAARHFGVGPRDAAEALHHFSPVTDRLEPRQTRYLTILNDAYNANPSSMAAAIEVLRDWPREGRRVAIVGDMLELGKESRRLHAEIGETLAEAGVELVLAAGEESLALAEAAAGRSARCRTQHFSTARALAADLPGRVREGDIILVKGSRGMRMEEVVAKLLHWSPFNSRRFRPIRP